MPLYRSRLSAAALPLPTAFSVCSISSLFLCINLANYNICLIVLYNEYYFSYSHYFLYTTNSLQVEL